MSQAVTKVVDLALSQVGYKETGTNVNKYAAYIDKNYPSFYNGKKQSAEWCDVFVDYLFLYNFGEGDALKMLYQPLKSAGAGCKYSANYYKANDAWYSQPQVGDQIFFGTSGKETHTGIVVAVSDTEVTTVEGNKSNAVKKCSYKKGTSNIAGYGRPKWSIVPDTKPSPKEDKTVDVELTVLKQGMKCFQVGTVQRILRERKYKYKGKLIEVDESFGPATDACVKEFQKLWGITVDGIVGKITWEKLLKG